MSLANNLRVSLANNRSPYPTNLESEKKMEDTTYAPATCSGCYNRHDPEMCPHAHVFSEFFECTHGHSFCTKH
jgi:hypothetical protein